jgi:hypothetical protein
MATTCVAAFGLIALIGLAFAPETRGAALPTDPINPSAAPQDKAPVAGAAAATEESHS